MASYHDLLDAIARIRVATGDPNAWQAGLTGQDIAIALNPLSPAADLGAVLAKVSAAHPEVFLTATTDAAAAPPPQTGEGAAAEAIRDAKAALSGQHCVAAEVDLQVVTAVLNAHATHADGVTKLGRLQREIEQAVSTRTDLDTPVGAREFQRFLIGRLRAIRDVVENAGLDAASRAALAEALAALYASSTPHDKPPLDDRPVARPAPDDAAPTSDAPAPTADTTDDGTGPTDRPSNIPFGLGATPDRFGPGEPMPLESLPDRSPDLTAGAPRSDPGWSDAPWTDPPVFPPAQVMAQPPVAIPAAPAAAPAWPASPAATMPSAGGLPTFAPPPDSGLPGMAWPDLLSRGGPGPFDLPGDRPEQQPHTDLLDEPIPEDDTDESPDELTDEPSDEPPEEDEPPKESVEEPAAEDVETAETACTAQLPWQHPPAPEPTTTTTTAPDLPAPTRPAQTAPS